METVHSKKTSYQLSLFLVLWGIVYGMNLLIFDFSLGIKEPLNIFYMTSLYFFGLVGATFIIIGNIPSLVEVFENTLGYWLLGLSYFNLTKTMKSFKSKHFTNITENEKFEIPFNVLLTTFNIYEFNETFTSFISEKNNNGGNGNNGDNTTNDISADFYLDIHDDPKNNYKNELLNLVCIKNSVGHFTWVYIASIISILLTINSMT